MLNVLALKAKMIINEDTGITLSKALDISNTTLYAKLNGKSEFTKGEIVKIKSRYNLAPREIDDIFFGT